MQVTSLILRIFCYSQFLCLFVEYCSSYFLIRILVQEHYSAQIIRNTRWYKPTQPVNSIVYVVIQKVSTVSELYYDSSRYIDFENVEFIERNSTNSVGLEQWQERNRCSNHCRRRLCRLRNTGTSFESGKVPIKFFASARTVRKAYLLLLREFRFRAELRLRCISLFTEHNN